MEELTFREMILEELLRIDPALQLDAADPAWADAYSYVEQYAEEKNLWNTAVALALIQKLVFTTGSVADSPFENSVSRLHHCLGMARILIDLHIPLYRQDEDVLLAAALCHILPPKSQIFQSEGILHPDVFRTITLIRREDSGNEEKQMRYFERVRSNKLALLLRLADRSNLVEQLYSFSGWSTRRYIHETRNYYLPMCLYAKEHYPDLIAPVSILMEKMRSLIEVAEILLSRYETREGELVREIFALQEENAMLQRMIRSVEKKNGRRNSTAKIVD